MGLLVSQGEGWQVRQGPGGEEEILVVEGQEVVLPVQAIRRHLEAFPSAVEETAERVAEELLAHLARVPDEPFEDVFMRLLPQLRSADWMAQHSPAMGEGRLITGPVVADLVVSYVLDESDSMVFVTRGHLARWGRTQEELHGLAMTNLRRRSRALGGLRLPNGAGARILCRGDGYDAASLLLVPELVAPGSAPDLLFAVPDRDVLWMGRLGKGLDLASLTARIRKEKAKSPRPLSDRLFRVGPRGLEPADGLPAT